MAPGDLLPLSENKALLSIGVFTVPLSDLTLSSSEPQFLRIRTDNSVLVHWYSQTMLTGSSFSGWLETADLKNVPNTHTFGVSGAGHESE